MRFLHKIRKEFKLGILLVVTFSLIGFISKKQEQQLCHDVRILIHHNGSNYFLDKEDVYQMATADESDFLIGSAYDRIDLRAVENRLRANHYVADAQAYTNLRGQMTVEVTICEPMARFIVDDEKDKYICSTGRVIPTSEKYTSRVLLINGPLANQVSQSHVREDSTLTRLYDLVRYIHADEFWRAQIAQMHVDAHGKITFYPQVSKQVIEFGKAEDIEHKFLKLKTFYSTILPYKGWNHYTRVNIEYKDQIVCE